MRIVGFRHRDLERLWRLDNARGVARQYEAKIRAMLTALQEAENIGELGTIRGWRLHPLRGDRKGFWSLAVTGNRRLTFRVSNNTVTEIDFEDYH